MKIKLNDQQIEYSLRKSFRAKSLRISINRRGKITVSANKIIPLHMIEKFVQSKADWILQHLANIEPSKPTKTAAQLRSEYIRAKPIARRLATDRLAYFNQFYGFKYHTITIRNQSSRWGSCNKQGNLSFNYRIALIDPELADLVIVHELCHLKEMNHSHRFWALVRKTIPQYLSRRLRLNKIDLTTKED